MTTHFDDLLDRRLFWRFFLEISTAHSLSAYMPLLATDDVSGGLVGAMEPIHHMDVMNMAVPLSLYVCACVRTCVRAYVRACVCVCVFVRHRERQRERERGGGGGARERLTLGLDCGIIFHSVHILSVCVASSVLQEICLLTIVIVYVRIHQTPLLIFTPLDESDMFRLHY